MVAPRGAASAARPASRGRPKRRSAPNARPPRSSKERLAQVLLVVVPLLLMLGSVYAHTTAAGLSRETALLEEEKARAEGEGERLEVRVTELSEPGRVRKLARDSLGMRESGGAELEAYENDGEDVVKDGEEERTEAGG